MKQQEILAQVVRDRRAQTGLTQHEVAARCSFNREWLSSVEQARMKEPDREWLAELEVALGVAPGVFLQAAGYRVDRVDGPPSVKPKSLADILREAAIRAQELEQSDDEDAKLELRQVLRLFVPAAIQRQLVSRR